MELSHTGVTCTLTCCFPTFVRTLHLTAGSPCLLRVLHLSRDFFAELFKIKIISWDCFFSANTVAPLPCTPLRHSALNAAFTRYSPYYRRHDSALFLASSSVRKSPHFGEIPRLKQASRILNAPAWPKTHNNFHTAQFPDCFGSNLVL